MPVRKFASKIFTGAILKTLVYDQPLNVQIPISEFYFNPTIDVV